MCGVELTDETVREFSQVAMAMMNLKSRINEIISEWVEPGVLIIKLNRPYKKNALNQAMYSEITRILEIAGSTDRVIAVLVTGEGTCGYFCAGTDLNDSNGEDSMYTTKNFMAAFISFPKPIFVAVNGSCVGIGATLLPHCDFVYGTTDTFYWTPFARLAMVPEFCSSLTFPSLMGTPLANEVLYLERKLTEKEALSANLISSIIPPERIVEHVKSLAVKLASLPFALKTALQFKNLLRGPKINMLKEVLENEYSVLIARYLAGDVASAVMETMKSKL